jgi:hypothetical protein
MEGTGSSREGASSNYCEVCEASFPSKESLRSHLNTVHYRGPSSSDSGSGSEHPQEEVSPWAADKVEAPPDKVDREAEARAELPVSEPPSLEPTGRGRDVPEGDDAEEGRSDRPQHEPDDEDRGPEIPAGSPTPEGREPDTKQPRPAKSTSSRRKSGGGASTNRRSHGATSKAT